MKQRVLILMLAVMLALVVVGVAEAHANLARSTPAAGEVLSAAPAEMIMEFTENLDPHFTKAQLVNSQNQVINPGPGQIDPAQPKVWHLALGNLPQDSYTVIWKARSATDGHVTNGSIPFGIGIAPTAVGSLIPLLGAPDPADEPIPPIESAVRWLNLVVLALMLGGVPFTLFVWRPALRVAQTQTNVAAGNESLLKTVRRLIMIGSVLFLIVTSTLLIVQAAVVNTGSLIQTLIQMMQTLSGQVWLARVILTVVLIAIAVRLPSIQFSTRGWWLALIIGSAILLTFSLTAHGAALDQGAVAAMIIDWLHIAAMVAWLGGLVPLLVAIRSARRTPDRALPLAVLIPRFSRLALTCVVILIGSGLYSYLQHVNDLNLLTDTTYGRTLLIKSSLFAVLIMLGAINLMILSPRLQRQGNRLARAFGLSVPIELIVGTVLLLAAGALTSVAPSQIAWTAHLEQGITQAATVGNVQLILHVAPARPGDNELAVDAIDPRPGAQATPGQVLLRFKMMDMDMGQLQAETKTTDQMRYSTRGSFLSMGGHWQIDVILRRSGFDDVTHVFDVEILRPTEPAP
ncbi:MAG TPA: CopD family protein [Anaerolineae bacterium]|nr:CopD family protein [Anaerolineae bacterium]